jgi:hypothetical protein
MNTSSKAKVVKIESRLSERTYVAARVVVRVFAGDAPAEYADLPRIDNLAWVDGSTKIRVPKSLMSMAAYDRPEQRIRGQFGASTIVDALSKTKQMFLSAFAMATEELRSRAVYCGTEEFVVSSAGSVYWNAFCNLLQAQNVHVTLILVGFEQAHNRFDLADDNSDNYRPVPLQESARSPRHHNHNQRVDYDHYEEQRQAALSMQDDEYDEDVGNNGNVAPTDPTEAQLKELLAKSTSPATPAKKPGRKAKTA